MLSINIIYLYILILLKQKSGLMGRNILAILLLAAVSIQAQNAYPEITAKKQYELGVYDLALGTYLSAEKKNGLTGEEMALVGDIYHKMGESQKSLTYYDKALTKLELKAGILISKAEVLTQAGKYDLALATLSQIGENSPKKLQMVSGIEYAKAASNAPSNYAITPFVKSGRPDFGLTFIDGAPVYNTYGPLKMSARSAEAVRSQIGFSLATNEGSEAVPFFEGMSNRLNIGSISYSTSGKCVFTRSVPLCEYAACRNQNASLYIADFKNGVLSNEKSLGINKLGVSNFDPYITEDGKTIYFASRRDGGFGGSDLYKIALIEDVWSNPINLGNKINTSGEELTPMYSESKLYFASNGHRGLGGLDLFKYDMDAAEATVHNLAGINSSYDETYPYAHKSGAIYFTSNRNSLEQENIFIAKDLKKELVAIAPSAVELPSNEIFSNPSLGNFEGAKRVSSGSILTKSTAVVYYIQLAAFNKKNMKDFNQFRDVVKFGNVYKFDAGPAVKVRLGYFLTEAETRNVLNKIKKSGYPDAFIVSNALNTAEMELVLSSYDGVPSTPPSSQQSQSVKENAKSFDDGVMVSYKVRLASYEDPIWFDLKKVSDLGHIEQWSKGTWTIFILSGFKNFQEAELARIKSVNRGFASAEVVVDNGGVIESIKKN